MAYIATRRIYFRGTVYQRGDRVPAEQSRNRHALVATGHLRVIADRDVVDVPVPDATPANAPTASVAATDASPDLAWTREALNAYAETLGIADADKLPNKPAVLTAIEERLTAPEGTTDGSPQDPAGHAGDD